MGLPQLVLTWGSMYGLMSAMEQAPATCFIVASSDPATLEAVWIQVKVRYEGP